MPASLLSLPYEIRSEIYKHLSQSTSDDRLHRDIHDPAPWTKELPGWLEPSYQPSLSQACRHLHHEYDAEFFRQATLKSIVRIFDVDTDMFSELLGHFAASVRHRITRCSVVILWKPRRFQGQVTDMLRQNLEHLRAGLPALQQLTVDFRYFDLHDLDLDITDGRLDVKDLRKIVPALGVAQSALHLSAITSLLIKDTRHGYSLEEEVGYISRILLTETYVCWRLEAQDEPWAWNGMMPRPCTFFCYGIEAGSYEELVPLVKTAIRAEETVLNAEGILIDPYSGAEITW